MAIGLVSPCLLQSVTLAVPIQNINGVAGPASKEISSGPRRPSVLQRSSASGGSGPVDLTQQRGRPVPGLSGNHANGRTLAEAGANPTRIE